ncbi:MAG: hypothetical protein QT02_C0011G0013 [archaeon GW2011_AR9]|nr:MAG: hypothetical protein QT02_C0011G0013 [archaeon GW2011_AR9]MBS3120886.1 hypothetical protein [Candidatus Woesearchaeota archaeon]HIG93052.1 hypothetical protein [Candidatus Woesearchaeota archaeon]HIH12586.1 hypothetical protein [Candidatus Woesearchaeota archaeon]
MYKKGFLQVYLLLAIVFGLLGISDASLTYFEMSSTLYSMLIISASILFFLFNVIAIAVFHYHRVDKIAYVLPVYHIVTFVMFAGMSFWLTTYNSGLWLGLIIFGFASSLAEILFAVYLLGRMGRK